MKRESREALIVSNDFEDFVIIEDDTPKRGSRTEYVPLTVPTSERGIEESEQIGNLKDLPFYHPQRAFLRYLVLSIACMFSVGGYFAYDSIGVIELAVEEDYNISSADFGLLYSVYSFPNIILPFFGGFLIDKIGISSGVLLFSAIMTLGTFLVAVSSFHRFFWLMIIGRFLFGFGAETLYVAQSSMCCLWFRNKELALSLALVLSAGRLGSFFTFNVNAFFVTVFSTYKAALWLGFIFSSVALLSGLVYFFLHRFADTIEEIILSPQKISLKDVRKFPVDVWIICVVVSFFSAAIFPFQSTTTAYLETFYEYDQPKAAFVVSLIPLASLILSPIFGHLVDRFSRGGMIVLIGLFLSIISFGLLFYKFSVQPYLSILLIGLAFASIPSALWPALPLLVDEENIGMVYGVLFSSVNFALALGYWVQGKLDTPLHQIAMYQILVLIAFVFSVVWNLLDYSKGGIVNNAHKIKRLTIL